MQQSTNTKIIELMFDFGRHMKGNMMVKSDLVNLSSLQVHTIIFLATHPNSTMSEIAKHFTIELPSATSLVNNLYKTGLVDRKHEEEDRRKICIVLTKKGVELLKEARKIRQQKIEKILSFLSETEKQQLQKILEKICSSLGEKHE
jgi:DNA-binding MarR family transcriptional regulator